MASHSSRVTVSAEHVVTVRLPDDFPVGEAEVIVLARPIPGEAASVRFATWLETWLADLAPAPDVPLAASDRGNIYE